MEYERNDQHPRDHDEPRDRVPSTSNTRLTYSVDEVAAILGISRSTVYECIARGEIPAKRIGRRVIVVRAALEAFLTGPDHSCGPPARRLRGWS
jgi:excisionase family DNA binding protein